MKRLLGWALLGLLAVGGAPPAAAADSPTITLAEARPWIESHTVVSKAIDPSRDFLPRMSDSRVLDLLQTPVTSFDERLRTTASDPGGPTILLPPGVYVFDPTRPADGRIGPFSGTSDVSQTTTVDATADAVRVQTSSSIVCRKTRIAPNALMGVSTVGRSQVQIRIDVARPCRYELSASIALDPGHRDLGQGRAQAQINGRDAVNMPVGYTRALIDIRGGRPVEPPTDSLRLSGVVQPGSVVLTMDVELENTGPEAHASWTASLVLAPEESENELRWTGTSGARFGVASNWAPPAVPGAAGAGNRDTAVFDRRGRYGVDFSSAKRATAAQTHFRHVQSAGEVQFSAVNYTVDSLSELIPSLLLDGDSILSVGLGTLTSNHAVVGHDRPGSALLRVEGTGALWNCRDELRVGGFGAAPPGGPSEFRGARVTVGVGAELVTADVVLGAGPQGGLVEVEGTGASWTAGDVTVGLLGPGRVRIADGANAALGNVTIAGLRAGLDADDESFRSELHVSGTAPDGSPAVATAGDIVVQGANARLQISAGAAIVLDRLIVGVAPAAGSGRAECYVSGASLRPDQSAVRPGLESDHISVGADGAPGRLVVDEGDLVAYGTLAIESGDLQIATTSRPVAPSSVTAGPFTAGRNVLVAIGGDGRLTTGPSVLRGGGQTLERTSVHLSAPRPGGTPPRWQVHGDLTVGEDDRIASVTLQFPSSLAVDGDLRVGVSGSLTGSGFVTVGGAMVLEGQVDPGFAIDASPPQKGRAASAGLRAKPAPPSGGTLTLDGDLVVAPTGVIRAVAAGPQAGRVVVTGDATLDGTLVLDFRNGFAPRTGDRFEVLQVGGAVAGAFASVEVQGLAPGASFDVTQSGSALVATSATDTVALPVVTAKASPAKLLEKKPKRKGTIVFRRSGDVTAPLTVPLAFDGDAVNGDDCVQILDSVTFPARKRTVRVRVEVADDRAAEGPESLEVSVLPGTDAAPGLASTARFTIVDDERASLR